ncbi:peptidoglycan recognition protein family protein, partial [Limosilactobacillus fermentum]
EISNAAYFTAYMMKKYGLIPSLAQSNGTGTLWSHHNVSQYLGGTDHTDPDGYWYNRASTYFGTTYTMSNFCQLVSLYYNTL